MTLPRPGPANRTDARLMDSSCRITVKAIPRASRDAVIGWAGGELKVKVRAPAVEGRANEALCGFLAAELGLGRGAVAVVRGEKSRHKVLLIQGLSREEVCRRWQAPPTV
jgi:uncharacterized protein (TIGR00251 family)